MSTRLLFLSTFGLAALIGPCPVAVPGNLQAGDALRAAGEVAQTKQQADEKCAPLRTAKVAVDEETEIGGAVALNWASRGKGLMNGNPSGDELSRYLNRVGKNLAAQSERPTIDWTFGVVDSDEFNAYSAPGGYVFVTRGLLRKIDNEAQLAGVLAHEIAHITHRDALEVYNNIKANQCVTQVIGDSAAKSATLGNALSHATGGTFGYLDFRKMGSEVLGKFASQVVESITTQGFAHEDEFDADNTALDLIVSAGYDPNQFIQFLAKIPSDGGAFKNHPGSEERRAKLTAHLKDVSKKGDGFQLAYEPGSKDWKPVPLKNELAAAK